MQGREADGSPGHREGGDSGGSHRPGHCRPEGKSSSSDTEQSNFTYGITELLQGVPQKTLLLLVIF